MNFPLALRVAAPMFLSSCGAYICNDLAIPIDNKPGSDKQVVSVVCDGKTIFTAEGVLEDATGESK